MSSPEEQPLKSTQKRSKKKGTVQCYFSNIKDNITIEPLIACYAIPGELVKLATQNLNLDKACRVNKNYGNTVCDALIARKGIQYNREELAVQQLVAAMESWKNLIYTAIPCLLILFIGAWSDKTKQRKMCILVPIIGDLLMCLSCLLSVYYFYELPLQVTMFFEALFPAITGGPLTLYMGSFAYLSDVTSEESRTFRMGVVNICFWAAGPLGSAISGVLLTYLGYYGVFSLSSLLYIISIVYGFYFIQDPKKTTILQTTENSYLARRGLFKRFFNKKHVKDTLTVVFKKGPNNHRVKIILILAAVVFMYGAVSGEITVRYLYTRYRFNWDAMKYSFYSSLYTCTHIFGTLLAISLFSRHLKWDDAVLGLISNCSKILGALTTGLARNTGDMYIGATVDMFLSTGFTALRSFASKLCSSDDLGKVMSVFNMTEVLTSLVFSPIYSWVYIYTVEFHASLIYYISIVLTIPSLFIFGWFYKQYKRSSNLEKGVAKDEEMEVIVIDDEKGKEMKTGLE